MKSKKLTLLRYPLTLALLTSLSLPVFGQELIAGVPVISNKLQDQSSPLIVVPSIKKRIEKKQLLMFLKTLNVTETVYNEPEDEQWNRLARTFTHLRLYPLAMKCFLKTLTPDSLADDSVLLTDSDEQSVKNQLQIGHNAKPVKSKIIKVDNIIETFNDGKQARAYAMILHVKQPIRGTPKVHKLIYTGHTFITLIKYNTDHSYAALSFGFGPHKDNLLSATPIVPSSSSKFTDDGSYAWDEVVGKFISKHRFEKILQLTRQYDGLAYNLSTNNCTDFGLKAAQLAGLDVRDTKGSWPLGAGNSPGVAGQSILLGKFSNADTRTFDRLFIDTLKDGPMQAKAQ
jgi:hypothetical protein